MSEPRIAYLFTPLASLPHNINWQITVMNTYTHTYEHMCILKKSCNEVLIKHRHRISHAHILLCADHKQDYLSAQSHFPDYPKV